MINEHQIDLSLRFVENKIINDFIYDGQVDSNGDRCGYGRLILKNSYICEGFWSEHGIIFNGRAIWSDGFYYIGRMEGGYRHG